MNNGSGNIPFPDPDREARLIDALNSGDKFEVERAVQALAQLSSAWSIEKLRSLLQGADEELAKAAANALREIPGTRSTIALTSGFLSPSAEVRTWCAYLVGEMSLFGRRDDCLKVVTELTSLLHDSDGRVAREAVHALGKIGGDAVVFPLIDILSSPRSSAELRAYALHAPRRWSDQEIASFVSSISAIVRAYPEDLRREIRKQDIFQYAPGEIISLICPPDEQILPMFPSQPSTLLDFTQATQPSLSQDWRTYGERGDTVGYRLEVDPQLGQVLAKSGRGFHSALRHPPSDVSLLRWPPYRYYEMVVKTSDLGLALHINVAVGDEDQTLLYGPAQRYGPNPEVRKKEFQIPLDERVCDGTWHSVILDLMGDAKEAGWSDFWSVRWLALHGEMMLYRVRASNDLSALEGPAIDPVYKIPRHSIQSKVPKVEPSPPEDIRTSGQLSTGGSNEQRQATEKKDFFVSYNSADREWAEWIAWQLEEEGYTTIIQAWDFRPGGNFVIEMQRAAEQARRTIAVLSPAYLQALYTQPEWAAAFAQDPTGEKGTLLPVRVRECELKGLLPQIVYIDLLGLDKQAAKKELLAGVKQGRAKPATAPGFPGAVKHTTSERPDFPGEASSD